MLQNIPTILILYKCTNVLLFFCSATTLCVEWWLSKGLAQLATDIFPIFVLQHVADCIVQLVQMKNKFLCTMTSGITFHNSHTRRHYGIKLVKKVEISVQTGKCLDYPAPIVQDFANIIKIIKECS